MAPPIFIRGLSRSGGTLMVTLLDAHPDIAMSYELYPQMLEEDITCESFYGEHWALLIDYISILIWQMYALGTQRS